MIHSLVLFYQAITLNVAINSYNHALLTLLISNQFVEIKSAVFKKFEKENLFQLSCSDIVERFQLSVFLLIIALRNISEIASSNVSIDFVFESALLPIFVVYGSEILVDWLKHAFITKFNQIKPIVYADFLKALIMQHCHNDEEMETHEDQMSCEIMNISKRIGFSSLPLSCLVNNDLKFQASSAYDSIF